MANFQPILPEPQSPRSGSTIVPPVDVSGIARIGSNLLQTFTQNQQDKQKLADQKFIAGVRSEVLDLQDERLQAQLLAESVERRAVDVDQLGKIDTEEERQIVSVFKNDLDKLQRARRQGVLNASAFQIQKNAILKTAQTAAPQLGEDLERLTGFDPKRITDPESQKQASATAHLDKLYGAGNHGVKEFITEVKRSNRIQQIDQNKQLGYADAATLLSEIPVRMSDDVAIQRGQIIQLLQKQGGGLLPEQEEEILLRLSAFRATTRNEVAQDINNFDSLIAKEDRTAIFKAVDDEVDFLENLIKGRNAFDRLKRYQEMDEINLKEGEPVGYNQLKELLGTAGIGGINTMLTLLGDETTAKGVAELGGPEITGVSRTEVKAFMGRMLTSVIRGQRFQDRSRNSMQALISGNLLSSPKGGNFSQGATGEPDIGDPETPSAEESLSGAFIAASRNEVQFSGRPEEAIESYLEPRRAANIVKHGSKEDLRSLKADFGVWSKQIIGEAIRDVLDKGGLIDISFDAGSQSFVATTRKNIGLGGSTAADASRASAFFKGSTAEKKLQLVVDLSKHPSYVGIAPSIEDVQAAFENVSKKQLDERAQLVSESRVQDFFRSTRSFKGVAFDADSGEFTLSGETDTTTRAGEISTQLVAALNDFSGQVGADQIIRLISESRERFAKREEPKDPRLERALKASLEE